jgi:hypothetical protein
VASLTAALKREEKARREAAAALAAAAVRSEEATRSCAALSAQVQSLEGERASLFDRTVACDVAMEVWPRRRPRPPFKKRRDWGNRDPTRSKVGSTRVQPQVPSL